MEFDKKLNLKEKLRKHSELKRDNGIKPKALFFSRAGPLVYFVVFPGILYYGITEVLPMLYRGSDNVFLRVTQAIGWLISTEMMMNWFCIRYIDSTYKPSIHGTNPTSAVKENGVTTTTRKGAGDNLNMKNMDKADFKQKSKGVTQRKKVFRMMVATSLPNENGTVEQKAFDYWSWMPCVVCQHERPPRCHHCVLCKRCILKRDHHCYFAGSCIGVNNQRHFIVFLFWTFTGCIYSLVHLLPYVYSYILPKTPGIDYLLPITFVRAVAGYQTYTLSFQMLLSWCLTLFAWVSGAHFYDAMSQVFISQTTFEQCNAMKVRDERTSQEKLRSVFGDYWMLNFILPCHWIFRPREDPVTWPGVKLI